MTTRIHTFRDDLLGEETVDAVELGQRLARGDVSAAELAAAALARATAVSELAAVAATMPTPRIDRSGAAGLLAGVPTYVKDNVDVAGLPTGHGSEAFTPKVRTKDDPYAAQLLGTGLTLLGKTRLPEFGFNASTEFRTGEAVHNPWNPGYSVGASSGGAAALVASGVVPLAHANDGGGSIRIPAAAAGLVGLKPTRGRHVNAGLSSALPINIVSEGVVSRSVRDQAAFHAEMERVHAPSGLEPIGYVEGPSATCRRIGLLVDTINGAPIHPDVLTAIDRTAAALEGLGHTVEPVGVPIEAAFEADFTLYWGLLAVLTTTVAAPQFGLPFHQSRIDGLTRGLRGYALRRPHQLPGALRRLNAVPARYDAYMTDFDAVLSPTVGHPAPELGWLSPNQPFEQLLHRLTQYVVTTPLHNVAGTPGLAMPVALSADGLPVSVHLSGKRGGEATLLDLGYQIEATLPRPRIS